MCLRNIWLVPPENFQFSPNIEDQEQDNCAPDNARSDPVLEYVPTKILISLMRNQDYENVCPSGDALPRNAAELDIELARDDEMIREFDQVYAEKIAPFDDLFETPPDHDTQVALWKQQIDGNEYLSKRVRSKLLDKPEVSDWFIFQYNEEHPHMSTYM